MIDDESVLARSVNYIKEVRDINGGDDDRLWFLLKMNVAVILDSGGLSSNENKCTPSMAQLTVKIMPSGYKTTTIKR